MLDRGHIVESGSHTELLANDGLYAALYNRQMDVAEHDAPPSNPSAASEPGEPSVPSDD